MVAAAPSGTRHFEVKGGGYLIWSIEYQGRGLVHAHIIWRPAKMPDGFEQGFQPGQRLDWIDEWVCACIPDESVLTRRDREPARRARRVVGMVVDGHPSARYAIRRENAIEDGFAGGGKRSHSPQAGRHGAKPSLLASHRPYS